jgi:1-acyl-sn-glycerol-3-phosphate acyltransferase
VSLCSYPNPDLRHRLPDGVPQATLWYRFCRMFFRASASTLWQVRVFDRHHEPTSGSALYICNHQSFLDPMLTAFALTRPMNYMARESLFKPPGFGWWIRSVGAFPVKRGKADTGAIKEAMRRLKAGGQVTVYAEGTRTRTGRIGKFLPGVAVLAQRSADWTVPVLVEGAYDVWPRSQALPSVGGDIVVRYGTPIPRRQARSMETGDFLDRIRNAIIAMQHDTRRRLGREPFNYDDR